MALVRRIRRTRRPGTTPPAAASRTMLGDQGTAGRFGGVSLVREADAALYQAKARLR
jgi:hypothetical protein